MALSHLQTALESLDAAIATLAASASSDVSASFNGASYTRQDLDKLLETRKKLRAEISQASGLYEVHSQWNPR